MEVGETRQPVATPMAAAASGCATTTGCLGAEGSYPTTTHKHLQLRAFLALDLTHGGRVHPNPNADPDSDQQEDRTHTHTHTHLSLGAMTMAIASSSMVW